MTKQRDNSEEVKERPQNKNLKKFKKGECGNPSGRPKGKRNFDTLVDLAIEALALEYVNQFNGNPKNKGKQMKLEDVDIESDVFKQLVNKARNGDMKAIDSFLDRRHGKAKQPVELTGANGGAIEHSVEMANAEAEVDQWIEGWVKVKKDDNKPDTGTEGETKDK